MNDPVADGIALASVDDDVAGEIAAAFGWIPPITVDPYDRVSVALSVASEQFTATLNAASEAIREAIRALTAAWPMFEDPPRRHNGRGRRAPANRRRREAWRAR